MGKAQNVKAVTVNKYPLYFAIKKWSGVIPSTLIVNPKTGYRKFFEDEMKPEAFE